MVKSYLIELWQGRKVKILFARILASTKNGQILFVRILASTKNGQILFARIPARKKGENPVCQNSSKEDN
jgi:hypothetical protein